MDANVERRTSNVERGVHIHSLGVDWRHEVGFTVNRPRGLEHHHVLVLFTGAVEIRDADGVRRHPAGTAIIHTPGHPQWYRAAGSGFGNHWLILSGSTLPGILRRCGLPLDRPFPVGGFDRVPALLTDLGREIGGRPWQWRRTVALLTEQVFLLLARLHRGTAALPPASAELAARLRGLRDEMRREPGRSWTVDGMARRVGLQRSRFSELYQRDFGISPGEDVIAARIDRARWMLGSGRHPIAEVARLIGFSERSHFSRLFRKRVGVSPVAFRRHYVANAPASRS